MHGWMHLCLTLLIDCDLIPFVKHQAAKDAENITHLLPNVLCLPVCQYNDRVTAERRRAVYEAVYVTRPTFPLSRLDSCCSEYKQVDQ